ncbi:hypothetical protein [Bordetella petrii]|uniref:hypothetical protein n=1 Tax=Bordetella petrii TaxID=94624 RepID=UPI001E2F9944|nr:hypothetical protein [Bordetella petrii]MCD0504297.1 hypothetical protein [Bordetella petrii]
MCADFDYEDRGYYRKTPPPSEALIRQTRRVEAAMPGPGVPEGAWTAFFDMTCGSIEMRAFERMFAARKIAVAYLAVQQSRHARPRPSATGLRCVGD